MARPFRWIAAGLLLLAPLIAMVFTDEVAWSPLDFAAAALLLGAGLLAYEWVAARLETPRARAGAAAAILVLASGIWAEEAVGLFT